MLRHSYEKFSMQNNKTTIKQYMFNKSYHYIVDTELGEEEKEIIQQMLLSFPCVGVDWVEKFESLDVAGLDKSLLKIAANAYDHCGNTVLGVACEKGRSVKSVQKLIDLGADLNKKDVNKRNPLYWAIWNRMSNANKNSYEAASVVRLLLENGAMTHIKCYYELTPLEHALKIGCKAVADLIRAHDAYYLRPAITCAFNTLLSADTCNIIADFLSIEQYFSIARVRKGSYKDMRSEWPDKSIFDCFIEPGQIKACCLQKF